MGESMTRLPLLLLLSCTLPPPRPSPSVRASADLAVPTEPPGPTECRDYIQLANNSGFSRRYHCDPGMTLEAVWGVDAIVCRCP